MNAQGVTLIELMIALALGAIVSLGAVQLFDATQRSARLGEGQARVQENGRFALAFLREAVRSAGLAPPARGAHQRCAVTCVAARGISLRRALPLAPPWAAMTEAARVSHPP